MRFCSPALALLATAAAAHGQDIAVEITPSPALPGEPITVLANDATGAGLNLGSPCTWYEFHRGTPDGPVITFDIVCPGVVIPVGPFGSFGVVWDQTDASAGGALVPPGTYWVRLAAWDPGFTTLYEDWACLSIQAAGAPALTRSTEAKLGASLDLEVSSPAHPGAIYVAAASLTSNHPIALPSVGLTCIDVDPVLVFSLTDPATFQNFLGVLDGAGQSSGLSIQIPNLPGLAYQPLKVQAFLLSEGSSTVVATNGLAVSIEP